MMINEDDDGDGDEDDNDANRWLMSMIWQWC